MALRNSLSRPAAFFVALFAVPICLAGLGWILRELGDATESSLGVAGVVLLMAAGFGAPSYLLVGGVMFWRRARNGRQSIGGFALTGFLANFVAALLTMPIAAAVGFALTGGEPGAAVMIAMIVHAFGLVFAPIFGALFGLMFTRLARDLVPASPPVEEVAAVFR